MCLSPDHSQIFMTAIQCSPKREVQSAYKDKMLNGSVNCHLHNVILVTNESEYIGPYNCIHNTYNDIHDKYEYYYNRKMAGHPTTLKAAFGHYIKVPV